MAPSRIYAIGDIHGQSEKLRAVHAWIDADKTRAGDPDAAVVHVGDLVDRGPDSAGVIGFLLSGIGRGEPWIVLKGNHDRMFEGFMNDAGHHDPLLRRDLAWLNPRLGGIATLDSYGVDASLIDDPEAIHAEARARVPARHAEFVSRLRLSFSAGPVFFAHAGVRPGIPLDRQAEDDLLWIREPFLSDRRDHGALIIHGHTPVPEPTHYGNRINIDSGAGYGEALSAIVIEGRDAMRIGPGGERTALPRG